MVKLNKRPTVVVAGMALVEFQGATWFALVSEERPTVGYVLNQYRPEDVLSVRGKRLVEQSRPPFPVASLGFETKPEDR